MAAIHWILDTWVFLTAPIHELGHMVFGWLSLNPTIITGWGEATAMRDGFVVALGGILGAMLLPTLLLYRFRSKGWLYPVVVFQIITATYSIGLQRDVTDSFKPAAEVIWYLTAALSVVLVIYIAYKAQEEQNERREESRKKQHDLRRAQALLG